MIINDKLLARIENGYIVKPLCTDNIICGFSTREFNYDFRAGLTEEDHTEILQNRQRFFTSLKLKFKNAVFLKQVHEARVEQITIASQGMGANDYNQSIAGADAAITCVSETPLCLLSADCIPLIFYQPQVNAVGIAHAGWRGLEAGIAFKTVQRMTSDYKSKPEHIKVFIGPGIRSCCYEIGSELKQIFPKYVKLSNTRYYLDLAKAVFSQLKEAGIKAENIMDSLLCTKCNNDVFFSYRGGDKKQRMLSFVDLK